MVTRIAAAAAVALATLLVATVPAHALTRDPFEANGLGADASALTVQAAAVPPGFNESVALSGLSQPTAVRFAADGRVVVAEKGGRVKVFDSLSDTTPTVVVDLSNA